MSFTVSDHIDMSTPAAKREAYATLQAQLQSVLEGERDRIANLAQFSALLYQTLPALNWAGFYLAQGETLVLGPFQGKVACVRIAFGKGVCGTCAATGQIQIVPDVEAFPGHIACDSASRSELVLPVKAGNKFLGVLDLDSPGLARFDEIDAQGLERMVATLVAATDWA